MRTYVLYVAALTASANAAAQVDIKGPGKIVGISYAVCTASSPTAGDSLQLEIGFNSAMQSANDANGVVDQMGLGIGSSGTGVGITHVNTWKGPMSIPVKVGDRLYLNATEAGSSTWNIRITIHVA